MTTFTNIPKQVEELLTSGTGTSRRTSSRVRACSS